MLNKPTMNESNALPAAFYKKKNIEQILVLQTSGCIIQGKCFQDNVLYLSSLAFRRAFVLLNKSGGS